MTRRRFAMLALAAALLCGLLVAPFQGHMRAAAQPVDQLRPRAMASQLSHRPALARAQRPSQRRAPGPTIEPYVRPQFAREMRHLRAAILAAAARHNHPAISGMSNHEFAVVIALLLYNENFGSLEEQVAPLRVVTPLYQELQARANQIGGSNLSVWPANLRPSVALEILRQQLPLPASSASITVPLRVAGSQIRIAAYPTQSELYAAITHEIADPVLAVEYLAANLERGLLRARLEHVPVTWRALAAWHNQGVVAPRDIRTNPTASDYVRRSSAYLPAARQLIATPTECRFLRCQLGDASDFGVPVGYW